jgi:hypothetical protein
VRDHERQRTYDAETQAFEGTLAEAPLTFAEVLELTRAITATRWWRRHGTPVTVGRGQGLAIHSNFNRSTGLLTLTEAQQNPATLAHELAHAASDDAHGPRFRAALCALVHGLCGAGPATVLHTEFQTAGLTVCSIDREGLPDPPLLARHPRFDV